MISEKSILQTDFEGEKLARIYTVPGKNNILHWKKILLMMNIMLKKNLKLLYMYVREKNQDVRILQKCKISRSHIP